MQYNIDGLNFLQLYVLSIVPFRYRACYFIDSKHNVYVLLAQTEDKSELQAQNTSAVNYATLRCDDIPGESRVVYFLFTPRGEN